MPRLARRFGLRTAIALAILFACAPADAAGPPVPLASPVCSCAAYPGPHYHLRPPSPGFAPRPGRYSMRGGGVGAGVGGAVNPSDAGPIYGLPRGRRYYGGRYFGSFNNRFYGPQYGYF